MKILDIIAEETGGERQYSDQYQIRSNGSHTRHRKQTKPPLVEWRVEFESENVVFVEARTQYEAEQIALQARPDEEIWESMPVEDWERNYVL